METQSWLTDCLAGDFRAFDPVVRALQQPLFQYLYRKTGSRVIAQDLTQESFLRAYQRLASFDTAQPFRPWLWAIARNLCADFFRSRQPWEGSHQEPLRPEHWVTEATAQEQMEEGELSKKLQSHLEKMRREVREVLLLHYAGDWKVREIAEMLKMPLNTVLSHLSRGRQELRLLLEGDV